MDDIALMREIARLQEQISALRTIETGGVWKDWTPTWTATTNPSIGDGTLFGNYCIIGKTVFFEILMHAGSTTTFGVGNWKFALPITTGANNRSVGSFTINDATAVRYAGGIQMSGNATYITAFIRDTVSSNTFTATTPMTWAINDYLFMSGFYLID